MHCGGLRSGASGHATRMDAAARRPERCRALREPLQSRRTDPAVEPRGPLDQTRPAEARGQGSERE